LELSDAVLTWPKALMTLVRDNAVGEREFLAGFEKRVGH
jgi:hypothetical protein